MRGAEYQAEHPGGDHAQAIVPLVHGAERLADRQAPVDGHQDEHVGGREHAHDLEVFHQPAQQIRPIEAKRDVPDELR